MYAPSKGEPEWIEIFNKTDSPVNIKNWFISDARSSVRITNTDKILEENDYLIISEDSSVFEYYSVSSEVIVINLTALIKQFTGKSLNSDYRSIIQINTESKAILKVKIILLHCLKQKKMRIWKT